MTNNTEPFWGKTLRLLREIWPLGDSQNLKEGLLPDLPEASLAIIRQAIDSCLEGKGGEVSARARAAELGLGYLGLSKTGKRRFLELLAVEYDVDNVAVERALEGRSGFQSPFDLHQANRHLRGLLESPRTRLLRQFSTLKQGVKFLVDLRADLLPLTRENLALKALDEDVQRLLSSWFDIGFLDLQRITWSTPANVLEKLIEYESVHAISSWQDLKNRLRNDRRCYAFFHPRMPDEPLIFVEVALVNGLADNVLQLLDLHSPVGTPEKADTAIFYSISNCQQGLAGVSFGNFLIKQVVADLSAKLPNLKTFSTLSPIPGFIGWLKEHHGQLNLDEEATAQLAPLLSKEVPTMQLQQLVTETPAPAGRPELGELLLQLCARYLAMEKRGRIALDRVAHFHLSNGARIERLNWGGNLSDAGLQQSAGIMVNYLYNLSQIEKNHEAYAGNGEITVSSAVKKLLKS